MSNEEKVICPSCGKMRMVRAEKINRPNFTGLCRHCWACVNGGCHSQKQRERIAQSLVKHTEIDGTNTQSAGCKSIHKSLSLWHGRPNHCANNPNHIVQNGRYERANLTGIYTRNIKDYISLCPRCHKHYDRNLIRILGLFKFERMALNEI